MLDSVLKILSVLGIILLVLLAVLLVMVLLALFFPIAYQVSGRKKGKELQASVKANWLLGLLRMRFIYPEPGTAVVKLLWFTLFDSSGAKSKTVEEKQTKTAAQERTKAKTAEEKAAEAESKQQEAKGNPTKTREKEKTAEEHAERDATEEPATDAGKESNAEENGKKQEKETGEAAGKNKDKKIKYTISKIYDKIKHIAENIAFYRELLQEEETKKLFRHAMYRLGRILKSIRPRKLKGNILFGTGSPDTTGYAYGVYGMVSAWLGNDIYVTPDFTQAILEGELYAAGHITVFQLLWHSLRVVLDKRLRVLLHKLKTHKI